MPTRPDIRARERVGERGREKEGEEEGGREGGREGCSGEERDVSMSSAALCSLTLILFFFCFQLSGEIPAVIYQYSDLSYI